MNTTAAHSSASNVEQPKPRSRFGRSKFGGSPAALIAGSIVAGLAAAFAAALIFWAIVRPEETALYLSIFTLFLLPVATAGAWAFLVDRETITGATKNPESSIESSWYDNAAQTTFHNILLAVGILGVASVFTDMQLSLGTFVIASYIFILVAFAGSYLLNKRRDS